MGIVEMLEQELNILDFSLTDYTKKSWLNLLGSLVLAGGLCCMGVFLWKLVPVVFHARNIFFSQPNLGLKSNFETMLFLLLFPIIFLILAVVAELFIALYTLKVVFEIFAKLVDLLARPFNQFRGQEFVLGESLRAVKETLISFFSSPTAVNTKAGAITSYSVPDAQF